MKLLKSILWAVPLFVALAKYYTTQSTDSIYNIVTIGAGLLVLTIGYIQSQHCLICAPEISTFTDHMQNFKIINLGNKPIKYTFKFLPDAGVEVQPLSKFSGVVKGHQSITVNVFELVELTGGSTVSASIAFNVPANKVTVTQRTRDLKNNNFVKSELGTK